MKATNTLLLFNVSSLTTMAIAILVKIIFIHSRKPAFFRTTATKLVNLP